MKNTRRNVKLISISNFTKESVEQLINKLNSDQISITHDTATIPGTAKIVDNYIEITVDNKKSSDDSFRFTDLVLGLSTK